MEKYRAQISVNYCHDFFSGFNLRSGKENYSNTGNTRKTDSVFIIFHYHLSILLDATGG
jgi:hypothetical protein